MFDVIANLRCGLFRLEFPLRLTDHFFNGLTSSSMDDHSLNYKQKSLLPTVRNGGIRLLFKFLLILLVSCLLQVVSCDDKLPDFSKLPTPPVFIHKPNPRILYFVSEQSAAVNVTDKSRLNLRERKFECHAIGYPYINYRWTKDNKIINFSDPLYANRVTRNSSVGSFTIRRLRSEDEGIYQCFAENDNGTAVDRPIQFVKAYISWMSPQIETIDVQLGEPFRKNCTPPFSIPAAKAYWILMSGPTAERRLFQTINFTNVAINDKGEIFFQYVQEEDNIPDYYYTCMAENTELKDYKFGAQFRFNIIKDPMIRTSLGPYILPRPQYYSLERLTILKGESLELFCVVSGFPGYFPTWGKENGLIDPMRTSYNTNFKKSIKIDAILPEDAGIYYCRFNNSRYDRKFHVTVKASPYWINGQPKSVNTSEGSDVEFVCNATGNPYPTFRFYKNGIEIFSTTTKFKIDGFRLTIKNVMKASDGTGDNAVYQCKATNNYGYVWGNFYLNLWSFSPIVLENPSPIETVEMKSVILFCKIFGSPLPTVTWWHKDPNAVGDSFKRVTDNNATFDVDQNNFASIRIENVSKSHMGFYHCRLSNDKGKAHSDQAFVRIKDATKIVPIEPFQEFSAEQHHIIQCQAKTDPTLTPIYEWSRDNVPLNLASFNNQFKAKVDPQDPSKLLLNGLTGGDSGIYTCSVTTALDKVNASSLIVIKDVPPSPFHLHIKCEHNASRISFYYQESSTILTHDAKYPDSSLAANRWLIQYTVDENEPDGWETHVADVRRLENGQGLLLVSLFPYGRFAFRALAQNSIGLSLPAYPYEVENGVDNRCITGVQPPPRNPSHVETKNNNDNTLTITWEPLPRRDWFGPDLQYVVEYKRADDDDAEPIRVNVTDPERDTLVIENVPPYIPYEITVRAQNSRGLANANPEITIGRSGEAAPSHAPDQFKVVNIKGPSTITFSWKAVNSSTVNGEFLGYKIKHWFASDRTKRSLDDHKLIKEAFFDSESTVGTVYDLTPNVRNFATITVYNNYGEGPSSPVINFSMPEGVPTAVQNLKAFPISHDEIGGRWTPPLEINGNFLGYEIRVCPLANKREIEYSCKIIALDAANFTDFRMSGLNSSIPYRVRIRGRTRAGFGDAAIVDTETTHQFFAPTQPSKPSIGEVQIGSDHVNVSWQPGNYSHDSNKPPADKFYFKYKALDDKEWTIFNDTSKFTSLTATISGLRPGTVYEIISVSDHGGQTADSATYSITTSGIAPHNDTTWFIAIVVAALLLALLLLLICILLKNRGAKYPVSEKEKEQGREPMLKNERAFGEYTKPPPEEERRSLAAESLKTTSETDSMAEYGDGEAGRFTEDGSFIGQYGVVTNRSSSSFIYDKNKQPNSSTFV